MKGQIRTLWVGCLLAIGLFGEHALAYPFLPGEEARAVSLGDTSDGRLVDGVRLEESDALRILPKQRARDIRYGADALVALLDHAAARLHAATGTRLWVGHLSRARGGDIPHSVSHNAGRDADVAFAYLDESGAPVDPHDFARVGRDGRTRQGWRFDAARTWMIVEALITFEGAEVQHIFMARHLEAMVLRHAHERGIDPRLRRRAAAVMRQPEGAASHDDHLHLRIYCSPADALGGCVDTGRMHPWVRRVDRKSQARALAALLASDLAEVRRRALLRLGLLGARGHGADLQAALDDEVDAVSHAAAAALLQLGERHHERALWRWFSKQSDQRRAALLIALGDHPNAATGRFLARSVADDPARSVRLAALVAIEAVGRLEPVQALIDRLDDRDEVMRSAARRILARLTNRSHATSVGWRNAWRARRQRSQSAWQWEGFRRSGYGIWGFRTRFAWELVRALGGEEHHAFNAHRVLTRLFGVEPAPWSATSAGRAHLCNRWLEALAERREAYEMGPPPGRVVRACAGLEAASPSG